MQRALGVDSGGFGRNVAAFAVTVPQGWKVQGGVLWGSKDPCNRYGYEVSWSAVSPDARYGVAIIPPLRWLNSTDGGGHGCRTLQIASAQDAVAALARLVVPNARMVDYRARPDLVQASGLKPGQTDMGGGGWIRHHVDAGEGLFSYTDERGNAMRATVALTVKGDETFMSGGGVMPDTRIVQGETTPAWVAFAPDGHLDLQAVKRIHDSLQINPEWNNLIQTHHAKMDGISLKGVTDRSKINRDAITAVGEISAEGFRTRSAIQDKSGEAFLRTMTERELWQGADGGVVDAPSGGTDLWKLDDGSYVSTDDPNFQPLGETGQFGTQLQRME